MAGLRHPRMLLCALAGVMVLGCRAGGGEAVQPTPQETHQFIEAAEKRLETLGKKAGRAGWVQNTYITVDTQKIAADAQSDFAAAVTELALGARRFDGLQLSEDDARKLKLLKLQLSAPAPNNPAERDELSSLSSSLEGDYGKGKYCPSANQLPRHQSGLEHPRLQPRSRGSCSMFGKAGTASAPRCASGTRASSSCRTKARASWDLTTPACCGARITTCRPINSRPRSTACGDRCSRCIWLFTPTCGRSSRRNTAAECSLAMARFPLISSATCGRRTGATSIRSSPRRHLAKATTSTASLKRRNADERGMVKYAENFFTSLGYQALPPAFWERSLFKKPADRDVVCHASASGWDAPEDVRIKMCVQINAEDFQGCASRARPRLLRPAVCKATLLLSRWRNRRVPRSGRRHDCAFGNPRILETDRPDRSRPVRKGGPRVSSEHCPRQGGVPAVRRRNRSVALESVLR